MASSLVEFARLLAMEVPTCELPFGVSVGIVSLPLLDGVVVLLCTEAAPWLEISFLLLVAVELRRVFRPNLAFLSSLTRESWSFLARERSWFSVEAIVVWSLELLFAGSHELKALGILHCRSILIHYD